MKKKVVFNQKQINTIKEEALNINVDVKDNNVDAALRDAKLETEKVVGSGKDVNYVISNNDMSEMKSVKKKELYEMIARKKINEGKPVSGKYFKKILMKI